MSLPTVGIICKRGNFNTYHRGERTLYYVDDRLVQALIQYGVVPLEILPPINMTKLAISNLDTDYPYRDIFLAQLEKCQGFVLQHGTEIHPYERAVAAYALDHKVPILGIGNATGILHDVRDCPNTDIPDQHEFHLLAHSSTYFFNEKDPKAKRTFEAFISALT